MRRILAGVTILGAVVVGVLLFNGPADATYYCQQGNHSCTTTTTEQETTTTTELETTTSQDTTTTSTTIMDGSTTTTTDGETTTTITSETTITTLPVSTTVPGLATWSASATCDQITAEWGEGISQVDLASLDTVPGTDEQVGDLESPFLTPGPKDVTVGTPTTFRLTPLVDEGWTVSPEYIDVTVPVCDTTTTDSTLPFTGYSRMTIVVMAAVAAVAGILGYIMVVGAKDEE